MDNKNAPLPVPVIVWMTTLCALWGLGQIMVKIGNTGISPLWQAGLRSAGAAAVIGAWMLLRRTPLTLSPGLLRPTLLIGGLFALEFVGFYWGLALTSAARGTLLIYTAPFFVALGGHFLLGERLSRGRWTGLAFAFAGVAVMLGGGADATGNLAGDLLCLFGGLTWAATTLVVRGTALRRESPDRCLFYQLLISAPLLFGGSVLMGEALGEVGVHAWTLPVAGALLYQIVVIASFSYLSWIFLIQNHSPGRLSAYTFLTPLFGVLFAALLLAEPITPRLLLAAALCVGGLWLVNRR